MPISINTDYLDSNGDCEPRLRRIAQAGFSHVHWCHHWQSDHLYAPNEIEEIAKWLQRFGLKLLDLHGSRGIEKDWAAVDETRRRAGVALVQNRIDMTARLGGDAVVMHPTYWMTAETKDRRIDDQIKKSLDDLAPFAIERQVRIAIENLVPSRIRFFQELFDSYDPNFLCFCLDSGHQNMSADTPSFLEHFKDRLGAVHLHDNDGSADQHKLPFSGSVAWDRIAVLMAESAYTKCVNLELNWDQTQIDDEMAFLTAARQRGELLAQKIAAAGGDLQ